jgi:hypothetical protein
VIVLAVLLGFWALPLLAAGWLAWRAIRDERAMRDAEGRAEGLAERVHGHNVVLLWAHGNPRDVASRDWPR